MVVNNLNDFKSFCNVNEIDPLNLLWDIAERNQKLLDRAIKELTKMHFEETEAKVKKKLINLI